MGQMLCFFAKFLISFTDLKFQINPKLQCSNGLRQTYFSKIVKRFFLNLITPQMPAVKVSFVI